MAQSAFLTWYLQHKKALEYLLLGAFLVVNVLANGYVAYIETRPDGIAGWKPWLWETSSAVSIIILLPLLVWYSEHYPIRSQSIRKQLLNHFILSVCFCAAHLSLMVSMRNMIYYLSAESYQFDWRFSNLLYEYTKDARVYVFFIVLFEVYRFMVRRWRGEASVLSNPPDLPRPEASETWLDQVLVKMLNQEFLIKLSQVDFIKSSGNYQELYVKGRAYPFRITQSALLDKLDPARFIKINRGEIINIHSVANFVRDNASEAKVVLTDGSALLVHKNYINNLPVSLRVVQV